MSTSNMTKAELDSLLKNGWDIDNVTVINKPKPVKAEVEKVYIDMPASGHMDEIVATNRDALGATLEMGRTISGLVQQIKEILERDAAASVPIKKTWEFKIVRDNSGYISAVVAEEI